MEIFAHLAVGIVVTVLSACALGFLYLLFRAGQSTSRLAAQAVPQVFELRPAMARRELSWRLFGTPPETELVNCIAEAFKKAGANVLRHDSDQLVAYFGSRAQAKMHGVYQADLLATPTRIILKTRDMHGEIWLQIRLDDDYGFQLMFGPMKRKFLARYCEVFDRITQFIMPEIERYNPRPIRIVSGRR